MCRSGGGVNVKPGVLTVPLPRPQHPAQTATRALGTDSTPADIVTAIPCLWRDAPPTPPAGTTCAPRKARPGRHPRGRRPRSLAAAGAAAGGVVRPVRLRGAAAARLRHAHAARAGRAGVPGRGAAVPQARLRGSDRRGETQRRGLRRVRQDAGLGENERVPVGGKGVCVAAQEGHLEVLQWAREHDCPWDAMTCKAQGGHLEVLQWAREHHCPWDWNTSAIAAKHRHLEVMKWALERGCPWIAGNLFAHAALGGQLEVLRWLLEHDYPWNTWSCASAAQGGYLEALKWLREHECPWDARTVERATAAGHVDVLQWALDNGCPT